MVGNCTDGWWLSDTVLTVTKTWFVLAHKIAKPNDLDVTKKFTDTPYSITFPTFLQLCDYLAGEDDGKPGPFGAGAVNDALQKEGCTQLLVLPPAWRQKNQGAIIANFVNEIVKLIQNAPTTGV